jgi:hypothetical protein
VGRLEARVGATVGANLSVDDEKRSGRRLGIGGQLGVDVPPFELAADGATGEVVADPADNGRGGTGRSGPDCSVHRGAAGRHVDRRIVSLSGRADVEHHVADRDEASVGHLSECLVAARATSVASGPPGSSSARNASNTALGSQAWRLAAIVSGSWNAPPQCAHAQLRSDMSWAASPPG